MLQLSLVSVLVGLVVYVSAFGPSCFVALSVLAEAVAGQTCMEIYSGIH